MILFLGNPTMFQPISTSGTTQIFSVSWYFLSLDK